ncbi:hypothetical protein [Halomonas sp. PR-M31]|nr:hypothetical protein [Halomonas sp. PR-M31]
MHSVRHQRLGMTDHSDHDLDTRQQQIDQRTDQGDPRLERA